MTDTARADASQQASDTKDIAAALQDPPAIDTSTETGEKKPPLSIRESLQQGFELDKKGELPTRATAKQLAAERQKRADNGTFAAGKTPSEKSDTTAETAPDKAAPADTSSATDAKPPVVPAVSTTAEPPPTSWSKEAKDAWSDLPAAIQQATIKREREIADGSAQHQQLKARYEGIESVLQPVRPLLQQMGKSDADAVRQLFAWHYELAGPNKAQAFAALARSHGIDLGQFTRSQAPTDQNLQSEQSLLAPHLQPIVGQLQTLEQRLAAAEQARQREMSERTSEVLATFAKDKPHFATVRHLMGQLMQSGAAVDLADAYDKATKIDPTVSAAIQQETEAKRIADAKVATDAKAKADAEAADAAKRKAAEAATNARRAAVSVRGGTPAGNAAAPKAKTQSVRESLRDAIEEARA